MKILMLILFTVACAHRQPSDSPSWVEGIRSGQERLRVTSGNTTLYRRIAETCDKATTLAEADIEREYQKLMPYNVEVIFYDREKNDCAVTLSANTGRAPASSDQTQNLELRSIMRQRSEAALKNAYTGITYAAFSYLTKDKSPIIKQKNDLCYDNFRTLEMSSHGTVITCWQAQILLGYCDVKTNTCGRKFP